MFSFDKLKDRVDVTWRNFLEKEFQKEYFRELCRFLENQVDREKIYPNQDQVLAAFEHTPFVALKVVILGQDPYHGLGQAHGLAFSVLPGNKCPPSLVNIFKELKSDLGYETPQQGDLTSWAKEGVFLLNTVLTVKEGSPKSHAGKGWELFTTAALEKISLEKNHVVFILWGNDALVFEKKLDASKHLILKAPHPSPLSVYRGFWGSKPFSQTNEFLKKKGLREINWQL